MRKEGKEDLKGAEDWNEEKREGGLKELMVGMMREGNEPSEKLKIGMRKKIGMS
jgi:hypothetical protein